MTTSASYTLTGSTVAVLVTLTELDTSLYFLSGEIDWGDGNTTTIPKATKGAHIVSGTYSHTYEYRGFYIIKVTGRNYRTPQYATDTAVIYLDMGTAPVVSENRGYIRGPILPDDTTVGRWVLNLGSDMRVIESDLMCLLMTRKGERLMNPDFGTNVHRLVFELDTSVLEAQVQQEISSAISKFEPRVKMVSLSVDRQPNQRNITVNLQAQVLNQFLTVGLNFS